MAKQADGPTVKGHLTGYITGQAGDEDVAELVCACNRVVVQGQRSCHVPGRNVIRVLIQRILVCLVPEVVHGLLDSTPIQGECRVDLCQISGEQQSGHNQCCALARFRKENALS